MEHEVRGRIEAAEGAIVGGKRFVIGGHSAIVAYETRLTGHNFPNSLKGETNTSDDGKQ
jgi:hypothetical protein